MTRRARFLATGVVLSVGGFCVALGAAELFLRLLPSFNRYAVWLPHIARRGVSDPKIFPGIAGVAQFTTNSLGIRARELGQNEYRFLAIGGSTTQGRRVDDSEVWTARLEQELPHTADGRTTWVGNVGRAGMNSRDHVLQMDGFTQQYPDIEAFLVLVGVNDLTIALAAGENYRRPPSLNDADVRRQLLERVFASAPGQFINYHRDDPNEPLDWWYKDTALWRLLRRSLQAVERSLWGAALMEDADGRNTERWRQYRQAASRTLDQLPDLTAPLAEYCGNLEAIADLAKARGRRLIFMTQPSIWRADLPPEAAARCWLGGTGDFQREQSPAYYSVDALAVAMRRFNETLLDVCRERSLEVVDLAAKIPRDPSVFIDDIHFTEKGERLVAAAIAEQVKQAPPYVRD